MTPIITIIVPVYNVERYLESCLDSIMRQDFKDWECILVDDGSKDKSGIICDEFSAIDKRFHVIHKYNGGVSSARNCGLELAKGAWICFVDSDDQLVPDALSHMLEMNMRTDADVCLCTIVRQINTFPEIKVLNGSEKERLIWSCLAYRTDEYVSKGFMVDAPHAKLFSRSIIENHNLRFVDGLCKSEDALFDAQFYHHCTKIVMETYPVYRYTLNPDSICHTYRLENIPMFATLINYEKDFVNKWYSDTLEFKSVLKVRVVVALDQVMYEAGADRLAMSIRVRALRLFMNMEDIRSIISETRYSQIAQYFPKKSRRLDLLLIRKQMFYALCVWVDLRKTVFNLRVTAVSCIKKIFNIDQTTPLISFFLSK